MSKIGYVRVSSTEQETARQDEIMEKWDVDRVFREKISGKNADRPELQKMLDYVRDGDVLYIESISRLARSIRDLLRIVDTLTEKGVQFVSSKESIDTSTPQGRFVLSVFAALSELEREQILQRQAEGIAIAKRNGKFKGKQFQRFDEALFKKSLQKWRTSEITARKFAETMGVTTNTLYRRLRRYRETGRIN